MTERCSKCGSPLDNEGSCFTYGKEQTEPEGYKVKTGEDTDSYSAYALVWPGSEEVEHLPEENQTPLYAPDTILEIAPRGMNMTEIVCDSCGFCGMISKQITDGYDPYCFRCGEQALTETREFSMLNMNRFKTVFRDKAGTTDSRGEEQ